MSSETVVTLAVRDKQKETHFSHSLLWQAGGGRDDPQSAKVFVAGELDLGAF